MSIKLINRNTDYAARALCYMARKKEGLTSVPELVKNLSIPRPFLRKILQVLHNKGLLVSQKGIGGKIKQARDPKKISLLEIVKVFQGPIKLSKKKKRVLRHKISTRNDFERVFPQTAKEPLI